MNLTLFDLDGTLIEADSDHAFGEFMVAVGWADGEAFRRRNDALYEDYQAARLDIDTPNEATLEAKMAQLDQASQALEKQAHTLFQKEQQLMQAEQALQQAGQETMKDRGDLEAMQAEINARLEAIKAERRILAADKAKEDAQIKLAMFQMEDVQEDANETAEEAKETNENTAQVSGQVMTAIHTALFEENQANKQSISQLVESLTNLEIALRMYQAPQVP